MEHCYNLIEGWFNFEDVYRDAVLAAREGGTLVEVGTFLGRSLAFLAVEAHNADKGLRVFCVDHWKGSSAEPLYKGIMEEHGGDLYPAWRQNMKQHGLLTLVTPLRMPSLDAAEHFEDESIDFVFLDAGHDYESISADIEAWLPKVVPGGTLAGHDYEWYFGAVVQAVDERFGNAVRIDNKTWVYRKPRDG
jgi:predicted O-methyltransferase YrrM